MQDSRGHDAVGLAALVRSGEVAPDELLTAARARAAEVDPRVNAIVREVDPHRSRPRRRRGGRAGRRRAARPGPPHQLVRALRGRGRRGARGVRSGRRPLRAGHPPDGRPRPGHERHGLRARRRGSARARAPARAAFHAEHDLLLTPTTATPPPRIGAFDLAAPVVLAQKALLEARAGSLLRFTPLVDQLVDEHLGWVPYTQLANLTGRPAMSVPLHWIPDHQPMGVQLVGRLGSDGLLLRLAAQLEQAAPWGDRRPLETP